MIVFCVLMVYYVGEFVWVEYVPNDILDSACPPRFFF